MKNRWQSREVERASALDALVYRSRLIGSEEALGVFGGGNTSIKCTEPDLLGSPQPVLWVKGSGADLKGCEVRHFAPLPMKPLQALTQRRAMADEAMVVFLERCLLKPGAPRPSIETLLHAFIPEAAIDHTHADAILSLANSRHGRQLCRDILGDKLLWIPYVQPGFDLSRRVFEAYQEHPGSEGAVLEKHGLITWGSDGRSSYARTIRYVSLAERAIARPARRGPWSPAAHSTLPHAGRQALLRAWLPAIRHTLSRGGGRKRCIQLTDTPDVLQFVNARRMPEVIAQGPATPDHLLRIKRLPLVLQPPRKPAAATASRAVSQLKRYAQQHTRTVKRCGGRQRTIQDPYPRVILIPSVGMLTTGKDATEAAMAATVYRHTMAVMRNASILGGYVSVSMRQAFNVEYWPLELYKLTLAPPEAELSREVGLITGAAGGIGRAIAADLVARGASVVVTDIDRRQTELLAQQLNQQAGRHRALGLAMDVTKEADIERVCDAALRVFGGLDFLVSNAGIAHVASIDKLLRSDWERSLAVNATGHFLVARAVTRLLRAQQLGGSLVFIASKNVLAPGKEFGAYSAAKAAETQLARILAIENGEHGIRVNVVNPDGVFEDSGLWRAIGPSRARTYGLAPSRLANYYQQRNLLRVAVKPQDVAEAVAFFVSRRSAKTTGCLLAVDGGLREAFPR